MEPEYLGRAITLIETDPHFFDVNVIEKEPSTADPLGKIPYIYNFIEDTPNDSTSKSFVVKITSLLFQFHLKRMDNNVHRLVVKFGLKCIRENPSTREFVFKANDYESIKTNMRNGGLNLRNNILNLFYRVNILRPEVFLTAYDIEDNFLYSKEEITNWANVLEQSELLVRDAEATRYIRAGVNVHGFKMNHRKMKEIEEELGIRSIKGQYIVDASKNDHFKVCETHAESQGPFVFILMPFNKKEIPQHVFKIYKEIVKEELNINCIRADSEMRKNYIESKIYSLIVKAKLIIGELSTNNSNVIFELGMALALNKHVILTSYNKKGHRKKKRVFDFTHFDTISYKNYSELRTKLRQSLMPYKEDSSAASGTLS
jgi:hypothetical protein